jgi:hypothetical protein
MYIMILRANVPIDTDYRPDENAFPNYVIVVP